MTVEEVDSKNYNLCCGQRWLSHQFEQSPKLALPVQRIYRLAKDFDSAAFFKAVEAVVKINPALRLRLVKNEGGWLQQFPDQGITIAGEEITGRSPELRAAYAGIKLSEEAKTALDLRNELPIRIKIIKVDGAYLLSVCLDHIAADEIAFDLLEHELLFFYEQALHNLPVCLNPSGAFKDYLLSEAIQNGSEQRNLQYWQQQFEDICINKDNPSANQGFSWSAAAVFNYELTPKFLRQLQEYCILHRCSISNLIIAAQLLLMVDTGETDDIIINIPISNRIKASDRFIIANLSMLVHVRFSIIKNEPIPQFVIRVRDQILKAMMHRHYDYPSLAHFINSETKKRNFPINLLNGCSFIFDNEPFAIPNLLFDERLDYAASGSYDIPSTSFTVTARQSHSTLKINMEWDASYWAISEKEMKKKFVETLHKFKPI